MAPPTTAVSSLLALLMVATAAAAAIIPVLPLPKPPPLPYVPLSPPPRPLAPAPAPVPLSPPPRPLAPEPAPVPLSPPPRPLAPEPAPVPLSPPPRPLAPEPAPVPLSPPPRPLAPAPAPAQQQPGVIVINGTVPCTVVPATSGPKTPVFPNATVLLLCGTKQIANTTTDANGKFEIPLHIDGIGVTLKQLLKLCKLEILTPLSACNASLPTTGILQSPLKVLTFESVGGILSIIITVVKFVLRY